MFWCRFSLWIDLLLDDRRLFSTRLMFPMEKCRLPWCCKVILAQATTRVEFAAIKIYADLATRLRRNAGKWWPQSFEAGRLISDSLSGFTCLCCVSNFARPCHGVQVWGIRYLWGREREAKWGRGGFGRLCESLVLLKTQMWMPLPRLRENRDPVQDWTKHYPNQNNNVTYNSMKTFSFTEEQHVNTSPFTGTFRVPVRDE